jgi:hypothetical protein
MPKPGRICYCPECRMSCWPTHDPETVHCIKCKQDIPRRETLGAEDIYGDGE